MEALQAESLLADSQPIRHRAHSHYIDLTASPSVSPTINPPVDTPFRQSGHFKTASSTLKSQSLGQHPIFKYQPTLNELQPVLKPSNIGNRPMPPATARDEWESFGSSLAKAKGLDTRNNPQKSTPDRSAPIPKGTYTSFIKPATPGAFDKTHGNISSSAFLHRAVTVKPVIGGRNDWPSWLTEGRPNPGARPLAASLPPPRPSKPAGDDNPAEIFNLDSAHLDAEDYVRHHGDPDKHMRELLSGAVGDGEDQMGDDQIKEGEDIVDGFANSVRLMPHQVRGTHWMRVRESGRKYGGILADDMGLGKTVQTLARIVEGPATTAEKKAGYTGGTLIVAPLAVMEQWASEVRTKTQPGRLKITTHHGPSRTKSGKILEQFDVVITTFQTLASEHGAYETASKTDSSDSDAGEKETRQRKPKGRSPKSSHALFSVKWLRIVIDEAQNVKNRQTKAAKASVSLKGKYRWCLTGTPIQNNVEELFSLFQFLRAKPLDDWHIFRDRISSLVKEGRTKLAMKRLHVVLKAVMLRRTKDATIDGKPILNLPGRVVKVVQCPFDAEERAFYNALEQKTSLTFNKFMKAGTAMANYTSVLTMLLRLRQACAHPSLVTASAIIDQEALGMQRQQGPEAEAPDPADKLADMLGGLGVQSGKNCELCFVKLDDQNAKHCLGCLDIARKVRDRSTETEHGLPPSSAKIRMIIKLLEEVDQRSQQKEKTICFSQFTSFLNLIEPFLKQRQIAYVRYDGSMKNDKRQEALERIKTSTTVRLILISFKAGSTGLNLTCCNNVILTDLWWNPALEDQAFDRAHRLGQKLDVNIFKLTIKQTVEDRILQLQDNKRELAKAALSGEGAKNVMKLTMNDIMNLFKRTAEVDEEEDGDD